MNIKYMMASSLVDETGFFVTTPNEAIIDHEANFEGGSSAYHRSDRSHQLVPYNDSDKMHREQGTPKHLFLHMLVLRLYIITVSLLPKVESLLPIAYTSGSCSLARPHHPLSLPFCSTLHCWSGYFS